MKQPFDHGPMIGMIQIVADEHRCVGHLLFKAERPASTARRDARNPPIPDRGNISRRIDHRLFECSDRWAVQPIFGTHQYGSFCASNIWIPESCVQWFAKGYCLHNFRRSRKGGKQCRSEEHTSELQSLMRISYAVFCLKKKKTQKHH